MKKKIIWIYGQLSIPIFIKRYEKEQTDNI